MKKMFVQDKPAEEEEPENDKPKGKVGGAGKKNKKKN
jgi:hypothetical protein